MRFLMNTLVTLTSTASIYAFRQSSLWMRPDYAALFLSCATPASGHWRLLARQRPLERHRAVDGVRVER